MGTLTMVSDFIQAYTEHNLKHLTKVQM